MSVEQVLNSLRQQYPHLSEIIDKMEKYYTDKLWHQLTLCLMELIKDEKLLQNQQLLSSLYKDLFSHFENKMDPIKLTKFICLISQFKESSEQSIEFLDSLIDKVVKDQQAIYILQLKKAEFQLQDKNYEAVDTQFKEIVTNLSKQSNIDTNVYSALYKLGYLYHKQRQNYDQLYKYGLQYLAYTPDSEITSSQKYELSQEMALAILTSSSIYNYSELLQQPVLQALKNNQQSAWIYDLLSIFNQGDVQQSNNALQKYSQQISSNEMLNRNQNILQEKIKILAFIDLVFNQPKNNRLINFQTIADTCRISLEEVELLLIRAMAKGLVRGKIDQVKAQVYIDWIIPRVLDNTRIKSINKQFESWQRSINEILDVIGETQISQNF